MNKLSKATRLGLRRLRKLAKHLTKNRGLDLFDFDVVYQERSCGTVGCAMGELPYCFPRDFHRCRIGAGDTPVVRLRSTSEEDCLNTGVGKEALKFFGLEKFACWHLFYPEMQRPDIYDGKMLSSKARPASVAKNILAFCALVKKGKFELNPTV
jgi:hypothetical protein